MSNNKKPIANPLYYDRADKKYKEKPNLNIAIIPDSLKIKPKTDDGKK